MQNTSLCLALSIFKSFLIPVCLLHVLFSSQNGPTQFANGSKLPLPREKHDETLFSAPEQPHKEQPDSDSGFDSFDLPEVPKVSLWPNANVASSPAMISSLQVAPHLNIDHESSRHSRVIENPPEEPQLEPEKMVQERSARNKNEQPSVPVDGVQDIQSVPFIFPPSLSSASFSVAPSKSETSPSRSKSEANVDLQDVLTAAQAAVETAERAAAAARAAASLAQVRINELTRKKSDQFPENSSENPFHNDVGNQSTTEANPHFDHGNLVGNAEDVIDSPESNQGFEECQRTEAARLPAFGTPKVDFDSSLPIDQGCGNELAPHRPQRLTSMDEDPYFSYPNLFTAAHSSTDNSRSSNEL